MTESILSFVGQPCPICSFDPSVRGPGTLFHVGNCTLACSCCENVFTIRSGELTQIVEEDTSFFIVNVESGLGERRSFRVPKGLAGPNLLKAVLEAYTRLEDCSMGWTGADTVATIFQLLHIELEKLGFEEVDIA